MIDREEVREKVIEGLERCDFYGYCADKQCPYYKNVACHEALRRDTLSLLKERKSTIAVEIKDDHYPIGDPLRTVGWKCGECGELIAGGDNYCPHCGEEIIWDD